MQGQTTVGFQYVPLGQNWSQILPPPPPPPLHHNQVPHQFDMDPVGNTAQSGEVKRG